MLATLDFLRSLLDTTQDGIVICDAGGTLQYFNDITRQMHGLPLEALPAENWASHYHLYHPDGVTPLKMHEVPLFRALKGEEVRGQEMVIQSIQGGKVHVSVHGQQILSNAGEVQGAMVVMRDLTREKEIQHALDQSQVVSRLQQDLRLASERALVQGQVLQKVTQRLIDLQHPQQMARVILEEIQPLLSIQTVSIFLKGKEDQQVLVTSSEGVNAEVVEALARLPLHVTVPDSEPFRPGQAQFFTQIQALQRQHPEFSWLGHHLQQAALAFLPITIGSELLGTLFLQLTETPQFLEDERHFMQTLADQVGLALERLRLREKEQALSREKDETFAILQAVLDHAPIGITFRDTELRFRLVNRAYAQYGRRPLQDHPQDTMQQLYPKIADPIEGYLRRVLQTGEPLLNVDFHLPGSDGAGEARHWLLSYFPVRNAAGEVFGVGSIVQDVSERKKAEQHLQQSENELREVNAAQKRFVADAAHELRNPLTSIQGNMDLMVRYKNLPEEDRLEMIQDVQKETGRLGRLVNDMLVLAKGDAGGEIREDDVELHHLAQTAFREIERQRPQHVFQLGDLDEVELLGDQDKLRQLLIILIDNAAKYTPPGGKVLLSLKTQGETAELRISDTGIGMAKEDLEKVFERFYRVDQSRNKHGDPGGTGLGLPIAKWIVEQHGGQIWFESTLGAGTTAVVRLPLPFSLME